MFTLFDFLFVILF